MSERKEWQKSFDPKRDTHSETERDLTEEEIRDTIFSPSGEERFDPREDVHPTPPRKAPPGDD